MKKGILSAILVTLLCVLLIPGVIQAQNFQFSNQQLYNSSDEVEDAVKAILKFFGSMVGSGLYHTADLHSIGGIDVGLRGVIAGVPDDFQELPVFTGEDRIGLAFLHGSIGLPGNFELLGRFFYFPLGSDGNLPLTPPQAYDSRGGVTLIGGGLKYGLLQQSMLPKIVAIGTYHALFVPSEFDFGTVSTLSFNAVASYAIPLFTFYAGAGIDITRLVLDEGIPFLPGESFSENGVHGTLGLNVTPFPFVRVNASYTLGEFDTLDLGVGISIR